MLAVTTGIAMLTAMIFGFAPLAASERGAVAAIIKEEERGARRARRGTRCGARLVAGEIALAVMLVVVRGAAGAQLSNLTAVDAGFDSRHLIDFGIVLPSATYKEPERRAQFVAALNAKLAAIPGVEGAAAMTGFRRRGRLTPTTRTSKDCPTDRASRLLNIDYYQSASVGYFRTMKIPIMKGRGFEPAIWRDPAWQW